MARCILLGVIPPALLLLIWHIGSSGDRVVVPSIREVADVLAHPFTEPPNLDSLPLADSLVVSLLRVALGFGAALATALPLGPESDCLRRIAGRDADPCHWRNRPRRRG